MTSATEGTLAIALDAMGADLGPEEVVAGAAAALKSGWIPESLIVVGQEEVLNPLFEKYKLHDNPQISLHPASEVIGMHEKPVSSIRKKKDASLVQTVDLVKQGTCAAAVSCGNTGSLMACSTLKLRPIAGVSKPALASVWPSKDNHFVVLDSGANPQCKPQNLVHYAILGDQYARDAIGIERPRIGLLSIGTEEGKGTELTETTHRLLLQLGDNLNYIGLIEGFQIFNNEVDVVVTDGFTGNVVLKTCESLWKMMKSLFKEEIKRNPARLAGAALLHGAMKDAKKRLDPDIYGGAPLLGLRGTVLKAHGSSNQRAIANALRIAGIAIERNLRAHSRDAIAEANTILQGNREMSGEDLPSAQ